MSKDLKKLPAQENGSLGLTEPQNPETLPSIPEMEKPPEVEVRKSKVQRLTEGEALYKPKKQGRKKPQLLTVGQYLLKTSYSKSISDLMRSIYKTEVKTSEEWKQEITALLKKRTW